jgi:hypothetical protein
MIIFDRPLTAVDCHRARWLGVFAPTLALMALLAGCQSIGPATVPRDRVRYADAITASTREQMLLNLVRLRYLEPASFIDVSSVVASYTFGADGKLSLDAQPRARVNDVVGFGVGVSVSESPTISYTPVTGERLANTLLRPIPPETVFGLIAAGGRADFLLRMTCQSINGLRNAGAGGAPRASDAAFDELLQRLSRLAQSGGLGLRRLPGDEDSETPALAKLSFEPVDEALEPDRRRVFELLRLPPERSEFNLVYGGRARGDGEVAVLTRSLQALLGDLSAGVEVPADDLAQGRATGRMATVAPLLRVHASAELPAEAAFAARYRDRWFWIDDRDLESKRTFMFLLIFAAVVESGAVPQAPLLTIPTR